MKSYGETLIFGGLMVVVTAYFINWSFDYIDSSYTVIFLLSTLFLIFMAFNIGGNDVANSFGTSVGAGTLSLRQALIVAAIFEVSGAMIAGGDVTDTIRKGIVDLHGLALTPLDFIYIMMSALAAAACWLFIATKMGLPVSTTHSIVGGIVGSSIALGVILEGGSTAFSLVHWDKIGTIASSWVISPLLGGLCAYILYGLTRKTVLAYNEQAKQKLRELKRERKRIKKEFEKRYLTLSAEERARENFRIMADSQYEKAARDDEFDPDELELDFYKEMEGLEQRKREINAHYALQNRVPVLAAAGSMIISGMILCKGLKHVHLDFTFLDKALMMLMAAAVVWLFVFILARTMRGKSLDRSTFLIFSWLQVFTASSFAFSHGSNDIANAIGPFAAIFDVLRTNAIEAQAPVPILAMLTAGVSMVGGLWFIGRYVIQTVGSGLTEMHPASGFAAELSASAVILLATTMGIPVSSTHILIGAVLGVGLVNRQANWKLMKPIGMAWIITIPAAAALSSATFVILRTIF